MFLINYFIRISEGEKWGYFVQAFFLHFLKFITESVLVLWWRQWHCVTCFIPDVCCRLPLLFYIYSSINLELDKVPLDLLLPRYHFLAPWMEKTTRLCKGLKAICCSTNLCQRLNSVREVPFDCFPESNCLLILLLEGHKFNFDLQKVSSIHWPDWVQLTDWLTN